MSLEQLVSAETYGKLAALRRSLRAYIVARGLCWLILALVAAAFVTLAIDYPLRLDRIQRAVIAALALSGIGYVVLRFLLRPLRVPMDSQELALVLEQHYPQLDDRLISSLQFAASPASRSGASEALIRRVAQQANALAGKTDVLGVLETRGALKRTGWPAAALVLLLAFTVWKSSVMGPWFLRNVLFLNVPYPRQTHLSVDGGPVFRVIRGDDLRVAVRADASRVVPNAVTFHMTFPGLGKVEESVGGAGPGGNVYVKTFENVADDFEFRVTGNDDRTDTFEVVVVSPPELVDLAGVKRFPDYMNRPEGESFKAGHGIVSVPPGTQLVLAGQANKDLSAARLVLDARPAAAMRIRSVAPLDDPDGPARPRGVEGVLQLPDRIQRASMTLQFELTDTEGITNPRGAVCTLRIDPDAAPRVSLTRRHVRGEVTARAVIPLVIKASDDNGVRSLSVSAAPEAVGEAATRPAAKEFAVAGVQAGNRQAAAEYGLQLEPMKLLVGQLIRVQALARDTLPESFGGPNAARSVLQTFKVVSEQELLEELVRRQKEIRQEFTLAVVLQAQIRDRIRATGDLVAASGMGPEVPRRLKLAAKDQRRVAGQCAVSAGQLQAVLDEMTCNRVGGAVEKRHLASDVIGPLLEISKKPMNDMILAMTRASKMTQAQQVRAFARDGYQALDGFYRSLEAILKQMKELENRQELANRLKVIIGISEQIHRLIEAELQRRSGTLFDPTSRPSR